MTAELPEVPIPAKKTQVRGCDAEFIMVCFGIPRSIFDLFYDVIPELPVGISLGYLSELDHRLYCEGSLS